MQTLKHTTIAMILGCVLAAVIAGYFTDYGMEYYKTAFIGIVYILAMAVILHFQKEKL